jgi:hypothetical protein
MTFAMIVGGVVGAAAATVGALMHGFYLELVLLHYFLGVVLVLLTSATTAIYFYVLPHVLRLLRAI